MNEVKKTTITTLEVAEMMEMEHWKLLRKLEGRTDKDGKHTRGYIEVINDNHLVVAHFFIKSSYQDAKGEERPCYQVTKMGCDIIANKSTGEKGVLFTARYVKRFYEMENGAKQVPLTEHPGEVANLLKIVSRLMERQGVNPYRVAENAKLICEQYGIALSTDFVKQPEYEQMNLSEFITH